MKTNIFSSPNTSLYSLIVFLSILMTSCGSFQNSSFYDQDGIYGNINTRNNEKVVQNNSSNRYKEYFNSLQNDNTPTEIFTNVDNYTDYNTVNDSIQYSNQDYADWGNNPESTSINVYSNPWSMSMGFGFGYPYYGYGYGNPYFGFGYPFYGYGYGYGYPHYGYGWGNSGHYYNSYVHNPTRRGSSYTTPTNGNRLSQNQGRTNVVTNNTSYRTSAPVSNTSRNNNTNYRSNTNTYNRGNYIINNATRNSTLMNRSSNQTQTNSNNSSRQSYTPSNSSRNSGSNNTGGGGRSSGGGGNSGGGGRSSGGGGRR